MRFACQPVDASFLERAPLQFVNTVTLSASAETVFAMLEDAAVWPQWFDDIQEVTWTSPRPFGVGTTRTVRLTAMTVEEHFFIWESGRRMAFYFTGHTVPLARSFAEDYRLEPLDDARCQLTWRVCIAPRLLLRLGAPLARRQLGGMFQRAAAGLAAHVADQQGNTAEPG